MKTIVVYHAESWVILKNLHILNPVLSEKPNQIKVSHSFFLLFDGQWFLCFFDDGIKLKIPSETTPPLSKIDLKQLTNCM